MDATVSEAQVAEAVVTAPDAFTYKLAGVEPYTRIDGAQTTIKRWRAACRTCGAPFVVTTPAFVERYEDSNSFKVRRCKRHRR